MTKVQLAEDLKLFCESATKDMIFPLEVQQGDTEQKSRAPAVYKNRLPRSKEYRRYAPYIIVQVGDSHHVQKEGDKPRYRVTVRFIYCVYCEDEQDGATMLLNLMDRIEQKLLKSVQIGKHFLLDVHEPLESLPYIDDTAPFFAGETVCTFMLPAIEREVNFNGFKKGI